MSEPDETTELPDRNFDLFFVRPRSFSGEEYTMDDGAGSRNRYLDTWYTIEITDLLARDHPALALHRAFYGARFALPRLTIGMN